MYFLPLLRESPTSQILKFGLQSLFYFQGHQQPPPPILWQGGGVHSIVTILLANENVIKLAAEFLQKKKRPLQKKIQLQNLFCVSVFPCYVRGQTLSFIFICDSTTRIYPSNFDVRYMAQKLNLTTDF